MPLPEALVNAPHLYLHCTFYYNAFFKLSSCREMGMGIGGITYFMCTQYCREHDIPYEDWDDFSELILKMDAAYLEHVAKEKPTRSGKKKDEENGEPE